MFWNKIKSYAPEIILLGATAFLQFYRLGIGEIQSWDEALYLLRAEACIKFGAWLDQAQYAVGGLYSSTHPPLIVWMMALSRMLLGPGVFASRIVSAIAAIVALYFFYKLSGKFFSRWASLFATVSLGTAQSFLWYSHHAQFDIPMFAFVVSCVYFTVRAFDEHSSKLAMLAGILFGCVLMSKAVQGIYLFPFLLTFPYIYRTEHRYRNLTILLISTLLIASPWFIYMAYSHQDMVGSYIEFIDSLKTGSFTNMSVNQWWYYLNQVVINFPVLILGILCILPILGKSKQHDTVKSRLFLVLLLWVFGMLVVLSIFQTRMQHFSLFLFLPTALLLCQFIEESLESRMKGSGISLAAILLLLTIGWSSSELIRKSFREQTTLSLNIELIPILLIGVLIILLVSFLYKKLFIPIPMILLFISMVFLLSRETYRWGSRDNDTFTDGAEQVGEVLLHSPEIHSVTAYHDDFPHEFYLPQLNYYAEGWFLGWDAGRTGEVRTWDEVDSLIKVDSVPISDASVVYVAWDAFFKPTPADKAMLFRINQSLSSRYAKVLRTKKYQLYWERR